MIDMIDNMVQKDDWINFAPDTMLSLFVTRAPFY